jgi:serine/threonine protein phosphatase PrpC
MPTRAFGDFRLKKAEFNYHNFLPEFGYRQPIPKFNGPYITHEPEIQVHDITKEDAYLVLASDGLWDEVSRKEAA